MRNFFLLMAGLTLVIGGIFIFFTFTGQNKVHKNENQTVKVNNVNNNTSVKELEIIPTMQSKSDAKNYAWAGNFQLAWNDFMDELTKGPVKFEGKQPEAATQLNKRTFTTDCLSESAYYKKWGEISPALKTEIEQGIKAKFNETSSLPDKINWTPSQDENLKKYLFYSMLKKNFAFTETLDNWGKGSFKGIDGGVEYFGINGKDDRAYNTVYNVFYNNEDDHAVFLTTKQGDTVYLYRTNENGTLADLYSSMNKKKNAEIKEILKDASKKDIYVDISTNLASDAEFKAPMLDFDITQNFDELCDKNILSPNKNKFLIIKQALQNLQLQMDEAGVKLKSEAAIEVSQDLGLRPKLPITPPHYYYNGRYAIFIVDKGQTTPYFAMMVNDPSVLQKNKSGNKTTSQKNNNRNIGANKPQIPSYTPRVKPPEGYQPKPESVPEEKPKMSQKEIQSKFVHLCRWGNADEVRTLLEEGADVHTGVLGAMPLRNAILGEKPEIIELLLEYGVKVTEGDLTMAKNHGNEEIIKILESHAEIKAGE